MNPFEYVMVLISIVVGLGLARILDAVGGMVDRWTGHGAPLKPSLAHGAWLAYLFHWMVLFWWYEFRFSEVVTEWTLGLYMFIVLFAILLFFLSVLLVPRNMEGIEDLGEYFLSKRQWFYGTLFLTALVDTVDSLLKGGWEYFFQAAPILQIALPVACLVVFPVKSLRVHAAVAVIFLVYSVLVAYGWTPYLGIS